ncbi:MAG: hypothetical protein KA157_05480 [Aliarcobacter sp.]|nr:hypothetical protein [Aliarcobacter sp.]
MKSFKEFLAEDGVDYFIIEVSSDLLSAELLINEGNWVDSGKKGYMYRIDAENPSIKQQRHVHIAKSKHISNKNMQVSWNQDGSKHDKKSFNSNVASLNIVQLIARDALNLSSSIKLEEASKIAQLLVQINESVNSPLIKPVIYRVVQA